MVCRPARVAEPDAALGLNLLQVGTAVGTENERHLVVTPRPPCEGEIAACLNTSRVSLGLIDGSRDVLAPPLSLYYPNKCQPGKESVVGRSAGGRPLGNREIAALRRPTAGAI